jgi:hypothetical protein
MQVADAATASRAPENTPAMVKKIGKTTYKVHVQLIISRDLTQLCNVEHGKASAAGNQNRLGCFSRDKLSRTF